MTKKKAQYKEVTGCLVNLILGIAAETLFIAICMKVFGMGKDPTLLATLGLLCVISAFVIYFDDTFYERIREEEPIDEPQVNLTNEVLFNNIVFDILYCPYTKYPCRYAENVTVDSCGYCSKWSCIDNPRYWDYQELY